MNLLSGKLTSCFILGLALGLTLLGCGDRAIIGRLGPDDDDGPLADAGVDAGGNLDASGDALTPPFDGPLLGSDAGDAARTDAGPDASPTDAPSVPDGATGTDGNSDATAAILDAPPKSDALAADTGGTDAPGTDPARPDASPDVVVCPGGQPACGGNCCQAPYACKNNACVLCETPEIACNLRCTDPTVDPWNCGQCGRVCPQLQSCVASACVPNP